MSALKSGSIFSLLIIFILFYESSQLTPVKIKVPSAEKTYYVETFVKLSWFKALQFCKFHEMELASINTLGEHDLFKTFLNRTAGYNQLFWTAGNDLAEDKSWFWVSNGKGTNINKWYPGEPNNHLNHNEHCIELEGVLSADFLWNDDICTLPRYFICELEEKKNKSC